jgi:hypothetical protein
MNEPNESGAPTYVLPEIHFTPDGQHSVEPTEETEPPAAIPSAPAESVVEEAPAQEPPIERHDPFAYMRNAPWMDRRLSASGRAAALLRRDLKAFPVIEGRDPNHADLDAIVKRTVDYIVPIIRREQATDIVYEELEKRRDERIARARAASLAPAAASQTAGTFLKETAKRAAPSVAALPAAALAPVAAAATLFTPRSSEDGAFELGEELRLRTPSSSLEGEIERRVGDRWESLGIRAVLNSGLGARVLLDDAAGFADAVGAQLAGRLQSRGLVGERPRQAVAGGLGSVIRWVAPDNLASLDALGPGSDRLPITELRMLTWHESVPRFGEIEREKVEQFCPSYSLIQALASEAGRIARLEGPAGHRQYGHRAHVLTTHAIQEADAMRELLKREGMPRLSADRAMFNGKKVGFRNVVGSAIIDVVEELPSGDICIHDIKTGGARFTDKKIKEYAKQGEMFFKPTGKIYVLPIYVEDMFGRDHNRK